MEIKVKKHDPFPFTFNTREVIPSTNSDDLYTSLRPFLIFGRLLGLVPVEGIFQSDSQSLQFRWTSPAVFYNLVVTSVLIFSTIINGIVSIKSTSPTPADVAWSLVLVVFYGIGAYTYIFYLRRARRLIALFKKWRETFVYYNGLDRHLQRDINILASVVLTSCILEHLYAHLKFFPIVETAEKRLLSRKDLQVRLSNASAWETYYWRSHPLVGDIIPYHWLSALLFFVAAKYSIIAWNCGDVLIAVMARALYYRFKILNEQAQRFLIPFTGGHLRDTQKWRQLALDHAQLCDLAKEFDALLSPLIFAVFGANVYAFCLQLNLGLTPSANTTVITSVYAVWSFVHLLGRILIVAIMASQVHVHAHNVENILRKCPIECFSSEVDRVERHVKATGIGLTGLGCFLITRQFILHLLNVVFTFEIVLLQTSG